ncbi:hypothetical protein BP6252_05720 [Coleophoma cylindrospora]|uniref:Carrier domain-containing protein n=1 Tax=Coleophoma cylindrospora TaxID=1849047 RepID=A0A3D8RUA3_9HELO|nr:hypothetical protein BP6252_05720 [Coleophoma cylindrospora]
MPSATQTPDYGQRLLPNLIDDEAQYNPHFVPYSFPLTENPADGFREISNKVYANAVNRTAWWFESHFGKSSSFESVGYIGPNDLRYMILAVAVVKCGWKLVLLSPRNSLDGHLAVINKSECNAWVSPAQQPAGVDKILEDRNMHLATIPELVDLVDESPVEHYPYDKTFDEARFEPFCVLHTSGSTGLPKPIIINHGWMTATDAQHNLPTVEGRPPISHVLSYPHQAYSTFPNYHAAALLLNYSLPFYFGLRIVLGPPGQPVSVDLINSMFEHGDVDSSMLAPSSLESMSNSTECLERMQKHSFVVTAGGPLSRDAGNKFSSVTTVLSVIGSTEGGWFPTVWPEREDWQYFHYHPAAGFEFREHSEGLYEHFVVRNPKYDPYQGYFVTFPELDDVSIKDLYSKHPTKPNRWLYRGRADHIIVLSNGEKLNPLDMEFTINDHPAVQASLIIGQGRFQTMALIQLKEPMPTSPTEAALLQESAWEFVKAANAQAPAHAQVHKDYVMYTTPEKPFVLAPKGSVLRSETIKIYEAEIDNFYKEAESRTPVDGVELDLTSLETVADGIGKLFKGMLGHDIAPQDDAFSAGLDSLSVFSILRNLRAALNKGQVPEQASKKLTANTIYGNPTIEQLSKAFYGIVRPETVNEKDVEQETLKIMGCLLEKYTSGLPKRQAPIIGSTTEASVILTGSTGSMGSYILDNLVSRPHIKNIYCLNRATDGRKKQTESSGSRGLSTSWPADRVHFLKADMSKVDFGLEKPAYDELLQNTTHIIHNQWQVDFNLSVSSFEPHIRGVRNFVDFSVQSKHGASIFFISSVAVGMQQGNNDSIPEAPITEFASAEGGYGQSKLISELILKAAASQSNVPCTVCRVGQISGPVNTEAGCWNKQEWFPTIISTSKYLGCLPNSLGAMSRIDWLPVNTLSSILLELASLDALPTTRRSANQNGEVRIVHTVNPSTTPWSELVPAVIKHFGSSVKVVEWEEWLAALEESAKNEGDVEKNPGIKLLNFYQGLDAAAKLGLECPIYETKDSAASSETLRTLGPVKEEWMSGWLRQWGF